MLEKLNAKSLGQSFVDELMIRVAAAIRRRLPTVSRIYVFGSAARSEMTDCSDIDVLVTVKADEHIRMARKALAALTLEVKWPLDLLIYSDEDFNAKSQIGGVCFDARHEGKLI